MELKDWLGIVIFSYSLGDAIDWKLFDNGFKEFGFPAVSYSLGDAIDWKLQRV